MEIREVKAENIEIIEEIIKLEKEVFGENGAIDIWNLKPYIKYGKVFVGLEEKEIIGCCELLKDWNENRIYLYGFLIKKDRTGKGMGSIFLQLILDKLKEENVEIIELTVSPKNISAIRLYEKYGFEKAQYIENEYGNGNHRFLYKKKLRTI